MFEIGQKVKVKSWAELVDSHGTHKDGHIVLPSGNFLPMMRHFCGRKTFVVDSRVKRYYLEGCSTWLFPEESLDGTY